MFKRACKSLKPGDKLYVRGWDLYGKHTTWEKVERTKKNML